MWNLQLSNNSLEWKNVKYGVEIYSDPSGLRAFSGQDPQPSSIYNPVNVFILGTSA